MRRIASSISLRVGCCGSRSSPASEAQRPEMRASPVLGVLLKRHAAREGAVEATGVEVVQEAPVVVAVDADAPHRRRRRSSRCRRDERR